jgi:hypothetical protein
LPDPEIFVTKGRAGTTGYGVPGQQFGECIRIGRERDRHTAHSETFLSLDDGPRGAAASLVYHRSVSCVP